MQIEVGELEQILNRVLATQQPFFADMMNRFGALESREIKRDESLAGLSTAIQIMAAADVQGEIKSLKNRLDVLEDEKHQRVGAKILIEWAPRIIGWLAMLVLVIVLWLKSEGKL